MKLWILTPKPESNLWEPWYDKSFGFVVRAETAKEARRLAQEDGGDEVGYSWKKTKPAWTSAKHSTCRELKTTGEAEVIMRDFASA